MLSDQAMWASVALVDYLRNGVPPENAPKVHAARALAALINCFRLPLDEYWERQIEMHDGANYFQVLAQAGYSGWELDPIFDRHYKTMFDALATREWGPVRDLPPDVWGLLSHVTGMGRDEWDTLPTFCRELLAEPIICPGCGRKEVMEKFGEPDPIDDPTYFYQQRVSLVFHCPECENEFTFNIQARKSREFHTSIFGAKKIYRFGILAIFIGLIAATLLYVIFQKPIY